MVPRLPAQVWTETTRHPGPAAVPAGGHDKVRAAWGRIAEGYQDAGLLPAGTDTAATTRAVIVLVQAFAARTALYGGVSEQAPGDGLRAPRATEGPAPDA